MVLYSKASNETSVNEARTLENIPPTQINVIIRYFYSWFNEKNNGYENLSPLPMTFYILHLTFMIPFIFHIRAVPIKLFVGIIGVLGTTRLRSICQSSIWYTSLQSVQMVPLPDGWGWCEVKNKWKPLWTSFPEASKACLELLKLMWLQTRVFSTGRCECAKANLSCTSLICQCSGECFSS